MKRPILAYAKVGDVFGSSFPIHQSQRKRANGP